MIKKIKRIWGTEEIIINNERYCAKFLNINRGYQSSLHSHKIKDETLCVLEGRIKVRIGIDEIKYIVEKGNKVRIYCDQEHQFLALSETAKVLEISTHEFDEDTYILENEKELSEKEKRDNLG